MEPFRLPRYVGTERPNTDYHHGQLKPARGVCCYQVTRANRANPRWDDGVGGTYKHAPDLAFWRGKFYVHYLTNPVSEHTGQGRSVLATSTDGIRWEDFQTAFPPYRIPACTLRDREGNTVIHSGEEYAVVHQRVGFYRSRNDRLLLLGFYGWSPKPWMVPWDKRGIGRVVREVHEDGTLGPVYFLRPCFQAGWTQEQLLYPMYTHSPDAGFVSCCRELLADPLAVQQWAEENGDADPLIRIKHKGASNQAFCWYHINEDTLIGLWKHSRTARSDDGGKTWSEVTQSPSLVMSGQKVWGQRCADGSFAMVYDPTLESTHRWPLCVTTSRDGLDFAHMRLVHGEVPPMRYGGFWKDMGPQYVRGISEGFDRPFDAVWVCYSVNKEDIWVARIPLPIQETPEPEKIEGIRDFNLYSPKWAPVSVEKDRLLLRDRDPVDYARAERLLPDCPSLEVDFTVLPHQTDAGELYCELQDIKGQTAVRFLLRRDGMLCHRTTATVPLCAFTAGETLRIRVRVDCGENTYTFRVNDGPAHTNKLMTAVDSVCRFVLRTGEPRFSPTREDDPIEEEGYCLPGADLPCAEAVFELTDFSAEKA